MTDGLKGGQKLQAYLDGLLKRVSTAQAVRVGFLEGSTYPDGTPTAKVAAAQEFGATIEMPARQQTIYRKVDKSGEFLKNGRFVTAAKSNFATTHEVEAHTITIPARPYFRRMIAAKSNEWGAASGRYLVASQFDAAKALALMGELIRGQLQGSIRELTDPPLAASTIKAKGFAKPLIASGHMLNSVDYEVTEKLDGPA